KCSSFLCAFRRFRAFRSLGEFSAFCQAASFFQFSGGTASGNNSRHLMRDSQAFAKAVCARAGINYIICTHPLANFPGQPEADGVAKSGADICGITENGVYGIEAQRVIEAEWIARGIGVEI